MIVMLRRRASHALGLLLATSAIGCFTPSYGLRERPVPPPVDLTSRRTSRPQSISNAADEGNNRQEADASEPTRHALVATARETLGRVQGPGDCVAFMRTVYRHVGLSLPDASQPGDNAVTGLYRAMVAEGRAFKGMRPEPGDLVFFEETYDRNRDGQRNDGLTHVAVVESVDPEGIVSMLHRGSRGASRILMDPNRPDIGRDEETGKVLNQSLRRNVQPGWAHLTGQLFYAYARVLSGRPILPPK
jgi:hypothetical protein